MDVSALLEKTGEQLEEDEEEKKETPLIVPDHKKTLTAALSAVKSNQTIFLRSGEYVFDNDSIALAEQIKDLSIEGETDTVIKGHTQLSGNGGTFKGITFIGGTKYSEQTAAISLKGKGSWRFDECEMKNAGGTYVLRGQDTVQIFLHKCHIGGEISDDHSSYGIFITGNHSKLEMSQCTVQHCDNRGICALKTSSVDINTCIIQQCEVALKCSDRVQMKVISSTISNNGAVFVAFNSKEMLQIRSCILSNNDQVWADAKRPYRLEESENVDPDGNEVKIRDHKDKKKSAKEKTEMRKSSSDLGPCY